MNTFQTVLVLGSGAAVVSAGYYLCNMMRAAVAIASIAEGEDDALRVIEERFALAAANSNTPMLTDDQQLVLDELSEEVGFTATHLARITGITASRVNAARRELAALGLAKYGPMFNQETGAPHGSGYLLTAQGIEARRDLRRKALVA